MDQQVWNPIFSPSGTTPGKSPSYYNELAPQSQSHISNQDPQLPLQTQHHQLFHIDGGSNHSTPSGNIQLPSSSQQNTPHIVSNTPTAFADSDQVFLQHMEMYDNQQHTNQSAGNTPGPMSFHNHNPNLQQASQQPHQHISPHLNNLQQHSQQPYQHQHSHSRSHIDSEAPSANDTPTSSGALGMAPQPPLLSSTTNPQSFDLGLDTIGFIIPEELNFDTDPNHISSAFPPQLPADQTPSLLAVDKLKQLQQQQQQQQQRQQDPLSELSSPVLPGQNDQSYNPHHYYHRQSSSNSVFVAGKNTGSSVSAPSQHVRPDAVFTPLVSPVVAPLDTNGKADKENGNNNGGHNNLHSSSFSPQPAVQISFEPLTSPALNAEPSTIKSKGGKKNHKETDDRRRSTSSAYAPSKDENKQYKRRTPHGTPILQGHTSNATTVNGSGKPYKSPITKNGKNSQKQDFSFTNQFEKLPESTITVKSEPMETSVEPPLAPQGQQQDDSNPMLPPNGKPVEITGAPLMGFTMGKLAEGGAGTVADKKLAKKAGANNGKLSRKPSYSKNRNSVSSSSDESSSTSASTSPKMLANNGTNSSGKRSEKPATKKASHKLAEQGRRNRMNNAVQELGRLIPQSYHDEVSIPSKATTVELASKYITALLKEVEELKGRK